MTGFFRRGRQEIRQGEGSEIGRQSRSRSGSRDRLLGHREYARQEDERRRISDELNRQYIPNYQESQTGNQAFPRLGPIDRLRNNPVNLSENNIIDTKNFILTHIDDKETFETLHERAGVIKYWIKQHKSAFIAINMSEEEYSQKTNRLKEVRLEVSGLLISEQYGSNRPSFIDPNRPARISRAIGAYKLALKDVLDVAHKLHRAVNGLPPLAPESHEAPEFQPLSSEQITRGAEALRLRREESERQQQQQEQQLRQQQQEQESQQKEFREEIARSHNTNQ